MRKLGPRWVGGILNYVRDNGKLARVEIESQFRAAYGERLSERTLQRCLHRDGIKTNVVAVKIFLTERQISYKLN